MLTDKLTSIANAIREKGGTTDKLTLDAMPNAIAALPTGGGGSGEDCNGLHIPEEALTFSGNCSYRFCRDHFGWFVNLYGDLMKTENIEEMNHMFYYNKVVERIPFTLNTENDYIAWNCAFSNAENLTYIAKIPKIKAMNISSLFSSAYRLRELPELDVFDYSQTTSNSMNSIFNGCASLRRIPDIYIKNIYSPKPSSSTYMWYNRMFSECYALDEVKGVRVQDVTTLTSNCFTNTITKCYHLAHFTFETNTDGTPKVANWKKQTIDLSQYTGWAGNTYADRDITTKYNSGITADKEVVNAADYERLKDDPDWWSRQFAFSRFGHDAAVELINSLPDASAYLATQTGTGNNNIIKFYTNAGMSIDGGGVSDLTEEEIAVAAAKGWTISYTG